MSVNSKMTAIADEIRTKTGKTNTLTLDQMAESIPEVYTAGQKSIVDKLELIPATASGNHISVDDVSEFPHEVECKIESINLLDMEDRSGTMSGISYSVSNGAITLNGTATAKVAFTLMTLSFVAGNSYALSYITEDAYGNTTESHEGIDIVARYNFDTSSADMPYINENAPVVFTPSIAGACQVRISIAKGTVTENITVKPILASGTTFMPYTPYVKLENVKVTRTGKNLCGGEAFAEKLLNSEATSTIDRENRTITLRATGAGAFVWWNDFKPNTQYTVVVRCSETTGLVPRSCNINVRYSDGTYSTLIKAAGSSSEDFVFVSAAGKTVIKIDGANYGGNVKFKYDSVGIFEGALTLEGFEPYNGQTLTPAADGTVEGMTSTSPYMNVFAETEGINIEVKYYKSPSTQTYYDEFWDAFQQNGNRTLYQYAFYGSTVGVWSNDNFKPKYPIKPINATQMLTGSGIKGDLTEIVDIDFSMANVVSSALYLNRYITRVGTIDIRNVNESGLGVVNECTALETVDKVILKDDGTQYPIGGVFNFTNCTSLKNIVFEGKITFNINFKSSPLTKESITSVVNALYEGSTGLTATFNKASKETAFTDDEWAALTATKPNWTFALL